MCVNLNRRLTVRVLEEDLEIPKNLVPKILTQYLGLSSTAAQATPEAPLSGCRR